MRVLLTEGSGLTSRQVATRLGELGHEVELLSSTPLCLARFTRHVRRVHAVPPSGAQPLRWLEAAAAIARRRRIDVVLPTQEQVAVLSKLGGRLGVATVVPPFAALRRVQDKHEAWRTLGALGLRQPPSVLVRSLEELDATARFPVYAKRAVSTASTGVRRARDPGELQAAARELGLPREPLLVQEAIAGPLVMIQAVADRGRLVAWHVNLRVREGAGGGASAKRSLARADVASDVERLAAGLGWHGAIALDAILAPDDAPRYIDVNPRLVEPRNAWLAGVDLVAALLELARGGHPARCAPPRDGVRSHQLLLAVLEAARASGRRGVARELLAAARGDDGYRGGVEELTPIAGDPLAALPVALAALLTAAAPRTWRWFVASSVGGYALTPDGWRDILDAPDPEG